MSRGVAAGTLQLVPVTLALEARSDTPRAEAAQWHGFHCSDLLRGHRSWSRLRTSPPWTSSGTRVPPISSGAHHGPGSPEFGGWTWNCWWAADSTMRLASGPGLTCPPGASAWAWWRVCDAWCRFLVVGCGRTGFGCPGSRKRGGGTRGGLGSPGTGRAPYCSRAAQVTTLSNWSSGNVRLNLTPSSTCGARPDPGARRHAGPVARGTCGSHCGTRTAIRSVRRGWATGSLSSTAAPMCGG